MKWYIWVIIGIIILTLTFGTMKITGIVKNFKIRNDKAGSGKFGAKRTHGKHQGIDVEVREKQPILAPFNMRLKRVAYPYENKIMKGAVYNTQNGYELKIFYFEPIMKTAEFKQGDVIGYAQSISRYYNEPLMDDHIHLEVRDKAGNLINPETLV